MFSWSLIWMNRDNRLALTPGHIAGDVAYPCTDMLPMSVPTPSPRSPSAFQRHVPIAKDAAWKNSAFDLMTRSAFITWVRAEPE